MNLRGNHFQKRKNFKVSKVEIVPAAFGRHFHSLPSQTAEGRRLVRLPLGGAGCVRLRGEEWELATGNFNGKQTGIIDSSNRFCSLTPSGSSPEGKHLLTVFPICPGYLLAISLICAWQGQMNLPGRSAATLSALERVVTGSMLCVFFISDSNV